MTKEPDNFITKKSDELDDPFAFFDIPASFAINEAELRSKYFRTCEQWIDDPERLGRAHKHYNALLDPVQRLDALLNVIHSQQETDSNNTPEQTNANNDSKQTNTDNDSKQASTNNGSRQTNTNNGLGRANTNNEPEQTDTNQYSGRINTASDSGTLAPHIIDLYNEANQLSEQTRNAFVEKVEKLRDDLCIQVQIAHQNKDIALLKTYKSYLSYYKKIIDVAYIPRAPT
ncbi:MAG: hypothetical protein LBR89_02350 [Holosporales bacterium]|jgi:hypothetical protein|nr:hypothetical protein [Holosporales bacterium]